VERSYSYFTIGGSTLAEIEEELNRRGPLVGTTDRRHPGATRMQFATRVSYGESNGRCGVIDATVQLNANMILPRWRVAREAGMETRVIWDTLASDIRRHEEAHVVIARNYARELETALKAVRNERDCAAAEERVERIRTTSCAGTTKPRSSSTASRPSISRGACCASSITASSAWKTAGCPCRENRNEGGGPLLLDTEPSAQDGRRAGIERRARAGPQHLADGLGHQRRLVAAGHDQSHLARIVTGIADGEDAGSAGDEGRAVDRDGTIHRREAPGLDGHRIEGEAVWRRRPGTKRATAGRDDDDLAPQFLIVRRGDDEALRPVPLDRDGLPIE
jgi:predicted secreted Zn-dependent protease